ncbi:hypothetical protein GGR53DRAFT_471689 [Hypoxylon sp. FL1150]|nr:hypothetical protein GGR53DRAFT_471689 [Hypoxylon sp. FL1150]
MKISVWPEWSRQQIVFNHHHDIYPDGVFLVADEGVFLDILAIIMQNMNEPAPCFHYNCRQDLAMRPQSMYLVFFDPLVAGAFFENHREKRIYRLGQEMAMRINELMARNCRAEEYKMEVRDSEHHVNRAIMDAVTRMDDLK